MNELNHSTLGEHYIVEASGCNPEIIGDIQKVQEILTEAAEKAKVTIWTTSFHRFPPNGVSGVIVIAESHISVHTWPEVGYAAIDIYTCGDKTLPEQAVEHAIRGFGASHVHITEITRGIHDGDRVFYHTITTWEEAHKKSS